MTKTVVIEFTEKEIIEFIARCTGVEKRFVAVKEDPEKGLVCEVTKTMEFPEKVSSITIPNTSSDWFIHQVPVPNDVQYTGKRPEDPPYIVTCESGSSLKIDENS